MTETVIPANENIFGQTVSRVLLLAILFFGCSRLRCTRELSLPLATTAIALAISLLSLVSRARPRTHTRPGGLGLLLPPLPPLLLLTHLQT